jgi:hypothetical protein
MDGMDFGGGGKMQGVPPPPMGIPGMPPGGAPMMPPGGMGAPSGFPGFGGGDPVRGYCPAPDGPGSGYSPSSRSRPSRPLGYSPSRWGWNVLGPNPPSRNGPAEENDAGGFAGKAGR